jgi:SAM-dependent methyltransferase
MLPVQDTSASILDPEPSACCVCGSGEGESVGSGWDYEYRTCGNRWNVSRCKGCGHQYLNPRPKSGDAARIYGDGYYTVHAPEEPSGFISGIRQRLESGRYRAILDRLPGRPKVLDLGFGDGRVLLLLRELIGEGGSFEGVDLNIDPRVKAALAKKRIRTHDALIETFLADDSGLDLVVMNNSLEHVWDPQRVVKNIRRMLRPGGIAFIELPNPDSLCRRIQGDTFWGGFHFPRHLNFFTKASLRRIFTDNGFEIVGYTEYVTPAFWVIGIRNRLGLRSDRTTRSIKEAVSLANPFALITFTALEYLVRFSGLHADCHRIIVRKPAV